MSGEAWAALILPAIAMVVVLIHVLGGMRRAPSEPGLTVLEPWAVRRKCAACGDGSVLSKHSLPVTPADIAAGNYACCAECGHTLFVPLQIGRKIRDAAGTRWEWRNNPTQLPPDDRRKRDPDPVPPAPPSTTAATIPTSADATVTDNTVTNNAPQGAQV